MCGIVFQISLHLVHWFWRQNSLYAAIRSLSNHNRFYLLWKSHGSYINRLLRYQLTVEIWVFLMQLIFFKWKFCLFRIFYLSPVFLWVFIFLEEVLEEFCKTSEGVFGGIPRRLPKRIPDGIQEEILREISEALASAAFSIFSFTLPNNTRKRWMEDRVVFPLFIQLFFMVIKESEWKRKRCGR